MTRTYAATVEWILSFVNWEAVRSRRTMTVSVADRRSFSRALGRLDHPERATPAIHVGGTNGKGSTAAIARALLSAHGISTGLYTSPHLVDMRERVSIDGRPIGRAAFVRAAREAGRIIEAAPGTGFRTTFEILTALAFVAFREAGVGAMVIEVGLGGRLDSTNVIQPRAIAMSSISLDHTEVLGSTLGVIATDKAGIFRRGVPVVSAPQPRPAAEALVRRARRLGAPIEFIGREVEVQTAPPTLVGERLTIVTPLAVYPNLDLALRGLHQGENAALAIRAVEQFRGGVLDLTAVREAFRRVRWPGRFELLCRSPWLVVDGAHNPDGAARLVENLDRYAPGRPVVGVVGASLGKDVDGILRAMAPRLAGLVAVAARHPRAVPAGRLAAMARLIGIRPIETASSLEGALTAARRIAGPTGGVCVAGSLYLVGDLLEGWPRWKKSFRLPAVAKRRKAK
ncbi:MAG: folylpolyglutamate synthase/dihydrofolate synthase family protein [Candidatus Eisenbacteria bacterium]|nr:folylpolyglutamate synthase/dihydrofolate synthase family protein [Candidatus Eisenbacteria bacterium]